MAHGVISRQRSNSVAFGAKRTCNRIYNSDAYVSCRMNIDNQRASADNVNRAIVGQYLLTHR
jgi:hypothetical protein